MHQVLSLTFLLLFIFSANPAHSENWLCGQIFIQDGKIELNKNQTLMVCGASDATEAWKDIPIPQAQYQLSVLLQNSGYLHPKFERTRKGLLVWKGPLSRTKKLEVLGADGLAHPAKKRKVIGYSMIPEKLDEVTNWVDMSLRTQGYPCPSIDVQAQVWDETVIADVKPGWRQHVRTLDWDGLQELDKESLTRFQAVWVGDLYDVRDLQITTSRLLNEGVVQSAYFSSHCSPEGVDLKLHAKEGKPRVLRIGFGASTEEFPFTDLMFRNSRLDERASSYVLSLHASPIKQSLNLDGELYAVPFSNRSFFGPRFELLRESEKQYEVLSSKLGADLGRKWDIKKIRIDTRLGPTLNYVNTIQGIGPDDISYLSWRGKASGMSHVYEAFSGNQFEGWTSDLEYNGQRKGLGSPINVDRYQAQIKQLWNLGEYSPPLFVLAWRAEAVVVNATEVEDNDPKKRELLPIDYRVFYGGDRNLRGFARQALDNEGKGYLTALSTGIELRLIEQLPKRLEPFLLFDAGKLGDRRFVLDTPLFTSWGFGMRFVSPIGTIRGSAAKGEIAPGDPRYKTRWVFFLSLGQEF